MTNKGSVINKITSEKSHINSLFYQLFRIEGTWKSDFINWATYAKKGDEDRIILQNLETI